MPHPRSSTTAPFFTPTRALVLRMVGALVMLVACLAVTPAAEASRPQPFDGLAPVSGTTFEAGRTEQVLVAMVAFEGDTTDRWTKAQVADAVGGSGYSLRNYFLRSSQQKFDFVPTVVDWTRVPVQAPIAEKCLDRLSKRAEVDAAIEAQHPEVTMSDYKHVIYLSSPGQIPPPPAEQNGCYADGLTPVPANYSWIFAPVERLVGVLSHETMHAFGLNHENGSHCVLNGTPAPTAPNCSRGDYADFADLMSGQDLPVSGTHRLALGLMPYDNLQTVSKPAAGASTTVTLKSSDATVATGTTQVLRIKRSVALSRNATDERPYYYIDFRTPVSPVTWNAPTNPNASLYGGVTIRTAPDYEIGDTSNQRHQPYTVNPSVGRGFEPRDEGETPTWNARSLFVLPRGTGSSGNPDPDVSLKEEQSFYDPVEDITITTTNVDGDSAEVTIASGPPTETTIVALYQDQVIVSETSPAVNDVVVSRHGNELFVSDFGNKLTVWGEGCRAVSAETAACRLSAVGRIDVTTGGLDDTIAIANSVPSSIPTSLDGGDGDDSIEGGAGDDLIIGGGGADAIDGGDGTDTVSYADRTAPVTIAPSSRPRPALPWNQLLPRGSGETGENDGITKETENLIGGSGADTIAIDANDDTPRSVNPGPGADQVRLGKGVTTLTTLDGSQDASIDCRTASTTWIADSADPSSGNCGSRSTTPRIEITELVPAKPLSRLPWARISFTSSLPGVSFECALDRPGQTGTMAPCTGAFAANDLNVDGDYKFRLWMQSGGEYVAMAQRAFRVERAAPAVSVSGPTSTTDRTPGFTLGATGTDSTFECRVNGGAWEACDSPFDLPTQSGASATFAARAISRTGVAGTESATKTVTFTSPAPDAQRTSGVDAGAVVDQFPSLSFSGPSGMTFACQVDDQQPQACASPFAPNLQGATGGLKNGPHQFVVTATDSYGNVDSTPLVVPFEVRAATLTIPGASNLPLWSSVRSGGFTFSVSNAPSGSFTYQCLFAYPNWEPCSPGTVFSSDRTSSGDTSNAYDFGVRMKDASGRVIAQTYHQAAVLIDATAPGLTVDGPNEGATITPAGATFALASPNAPGEECAGWSGVAGGSCVNFEVSVDGGAPKRIDETWSTGDLAIGTHTFSFRARDLAANASASIVRHVTVAASRVLTVSDPVGSPSAFDLTYAPAPLGLALDWVHWKGSSTSSLERRSGTPIIPTWTNYAGNSQTTTTIAGPTTFAWSNASGSISTSTSSIGVSGGGRNGRGFTLALPAKNTQTRKLKLWLGVRGSTTTGALQVKFNGETAVTKQYTGVSNTTALARTVTIDYRPLAANDTLTVSWFQGGGTISSTSQVVLYAAALY